MLLLLRLFLAPTIDLLGAAIVFHIYVRLSGCGKKFNKSASLIFLSLWHFGYLFTIYLFAATIRVSL